MACKLQVNHHTKPAMHVVFPVPSPPVSSMKPLIATVVLYLQVYHCPYPFSFAEADIFRHTQHKHSPMPTQADTYFQLVTEHMLHIFKPSLYSLWNSYITYVIYFQTISI